MSFPDSDPDLRPGNFCAAPDDDPWIARRKQAGELQAVETEIANLLGLLRAGVITLCDLRTRDIIADLKDRLLLAATRAHQSLLRLDADAQWRGLEDDDQDPDPNIRPCPCGGWMAQMKTWRGTCWQCARCEHEELI